MSRLAEPSRIKRLCNAKTGNVATVERVRHRAYRKPRVMVSPSKLMCAAAVARRSGFAVGARRLSNLIRAAEFDTSPALQRWEPISINAKARFSGRQNLW